jgi:hypothetical protein
MNQDGGRFLAVASAGSETFVIEQRSTGCVVQQFDDAKKNLSVHSIGVSNKSCSGVATDGRSLVVGSPASSEIRFFPNADYSKPHSVELSGSTTTGSYSFTFDPQASKLYVGDSDGNIYESAFGDDSRSKKVISHAGSIHSLAVTPNYLLAASGKNVLCYKKSDFSLQTLSLCMNVSVQGELTGIGVDNQNHAWILERDRNALIGPVPLK